MQPDNDNQPWTPKPYQPDNSNGPVGNASPTPVNTPQSQPQQSAPQLSAQPQPAQNDIPQPPQQQKDDEQEVQIWRHPEGSQPPIQPRTWHVPQVHDDYDQPRHTSTPFQPTPLPAPAQQPVAQPVQSGNQPQPQQMPPQPNRPLEQSIPLDTTAAPAAPQPWGVAPNNAPQTFQQPPQYGTKMAELPPLANNDPSQSVLPNGDSKKQRLILWGVIALLVLVPAIILGLWFYTSKNSDEKKQQATQQQEKITYNLEALQALGKNPAVAEADIAKLNKTDTFYTVFKQAALKPIVQTKWDVYYTSQKDAERGDNYTMYETAIDYTSKKYTYDENTYSNLGVFQTRCIGDKQYNYNNSKMVTSPSWQPATDSTNCKFNVVAMHVNDGLNTGGLTSEQADSFIRTIKGKGMLEVKSVSVAANQGKKYLKIDATVTPKEQGKQVYAGMQLFMNAFQATGLNADKHPYNYFGAGGEGAQIQYYVDLSTQLPVYAVMKSTPAFDKSGKPQPSTSWSHRYIEYAFPEKLPATTLDTHNPVKFSAWPDH